MLPMSKNPNTHESASPAATPHNSSQTFDTRRRQILQLRAARRRARLHEPQFILQRIAQDMADRLLMINRRFNKALLIAPDGFRPLLERNLDKEKVPLSLINSPLDQLSRTIKDTKDFDLILLCLAHHAENNPTGLITALKSRMSDDGHIMTVCLGADTFYDLRRTFYEVDQNYFGGIIPRIHPMIGLQANVQLLAHCGFNVTVGDRDRLNVSYKKLSTLINDLRDIGETYSLAAKATLHTTRQYWRQAEAALIADTDHIDIIYDILWATGWTPHDSQQRPLKPGSAKVHLREAFKPQKNKA